MKHIQDEQGIILIMTKFAPERIQYSFGYRTQFRVLYQFFPFKRYTLVIAITSKG